MTHEEAIAAGIIAGTNMVLATIVRKLDEAGIVVKAQFADELDRTADQAGRTRTPEAGKLDLFVLRSLAKRLRAEPAPAPAWKPTVVNGAKARE